MWPLPPINKQYTIIYFSPNHITCTWFEQQNNKIRLNALKTEALERLELEKLIIFNPSHIRKIIKSFLVKYQLKNPYSLFCLSGPALKEQFVKSDSSLFDPRTLINLLDKTKENRSWNNLLWDYSYLYPSPDGKFVFYLAGITRELLFQYQLLAINSNLNLIAISPATNALLNLYEIYHGPEFRQGKLGIDMARHNNNVTKLFNQNMLNELIIFNDKRTLNQVDLETTLASLGLFLIRNKQHAQY